MSRFLSSGILRTLATVLLLAIKAGAQSSIATPLIVLSRVGDGNTALSGTGNPVFLDPYDSEGEPLTSIPLSQGVGGRRLILAGTDFTQGGLSRTVDGRHLLIAGYDSTPAYPVPLNATSSATLPRVIVRVNDQGVAEFLSPPPEFASLGAPRSVVGTDGSTLWMSDSRGQVHHQNLTTLASSLLNPVIEDWRQLSISGNLLFASSATGSGARVGTLGTGLPVDPGQTFTGLPGLPAGGLPAGFQFADLGDAVPGPDTLYVADPTRGLAKYSWNGGVWVANGVVGDAAAAYRALALVQIHRSAKLYAIRGPNGGELVSLTDGSGANGLLTGTPQVISSAAAGTAFLGVAPAPFDLPDLTVSVSAPRQVPAEFPFAYTITVRNTGNAAASDIVVDFTIPGDLERLTTSSGSGFTAAPATSQIVRFTGGHLDPGESTTLTVEVWSFYGGAYTAGPGAAVVDPDSTVTELLENNNGSPDTILTSFFFDMGPIAFEWENAAGGNWSVAGNWKNSRAPDPTGSIDTTLRFNIPGTYTAVNDRPPGFQSNRIEFGGSTVTLDGAELSLTENDFGFPSITQAAGRTVSIRNPVQISETTLRFDGDGGGTVLMNGPISGLGGIDKNSAGTTVIGDAATYDGSTVIHRGTLALSPPGVEPRNLINDGGFELPHFPNPGQASSPAGASWQFTGAAGLVTRTDLWATIADEGTQAAFLDGDASTLSQSIEVPADGRYVFSFNAAPAPGFTGNGVILKVDGEEVVSWTHTEVGDFFFMNYLSHGLFLTAGSHTITLEGWNTSGGNSAVMIDRVSLAGPGGQLPDLTSLVLNQAGAVMDFGANPQTVGSITGVAGSIVRFDNDLYVGGNSSTTTFSGTLEGGGALVKEGNGNLTLTGPVQNTGGLSVFGGTLTLGSISESLVGAGLFVDYDATLVLDFTGTQRVSSFSIGESTMPPGIYNSTTNPDEIGGGGSIEVLPQPASPQLVVESTAGNRLADGSIIDFGVLPPEGTDGVSRAIRLSNQGTAELLIQSSTFEITGEGGGAYSAEAPGLQFVGPDFRLAAGASTYLYLHFSGFGPGGFPAVLSIASNDPADPLVTLQLSGAIEQAPAFLQQPQDASVAYRGSITIESEVTGFPAPDMQWFEVNGTEVTPIPGANGPSLTTPRLVEDSTYFLRLTNYVATVDSRQVLVTVGDPPNADIDVFDAAENTILSGEQFDLGRVIVGQVAPVRTITVANLGGSDPLTGLDVTITGPDAQDFEVNRDDLAFNLSHLAFGTINVSFQPNAEGLRTATLSISSSDPDEDPFVIELTGVGFIPVPVVTTLAAGDLTATGATLNGTVTIETAGSDVRFEYGESATEGFTVSVPVTVTPTSGPVPQAVSAAISGLTAGVAYKARLVASNEFGTRFGETVTFTAGPPPFTYTINQGVVTITGYTGAGGEVVIPGTIEGLPVVAIGPYAFQDEDAITGVTISEGVQFIEEFAFNACDLLARVDLPESLLGISQYSFGFCLSLPSISIPASTFYIQTFAFGASGITTINVDDANPVYADVDGVLFDASLGTLLDFPPGRTGAYVIPSGTTEIAGYAFYFDSVSGVTIPGTVTRIGSGAFNRCANLVSISVPASVSEIGGGAFGECIALQSITVDPVNPSFESIDGVLFNEGLTLLMQYPAGRPSNGTYVVPVTVTEIAINGFISSGGLTGVQLPSGLTTLGAGAFYGCGNLAAIQIPGGVTSIGYATFAYCSSLSSVGFSEGLQSIGDVAFVNNSSLVSIILPSTLTAIGNRAFEGCFNLSSALFLGDAPSIGTGVFGFTSGLFSVYYSNSAAGFSTPTWQGWPAQPVGVGPSITVQPADIALAQGQATVTLTVTAGGSPAPTYQWFRGESGDTSVPVSPVLTDPEWSFPAPGASTRYWVRVANPSGVLFSRAALVTVPVPLSGNANLAGLVVTPATLSPAFSPLVTAYAAAVPNTVASVTLTPTLADPAATLAINEAQAVSGAVAGPFPLAVGSNTITLRVTAPNATTKTYQVQINRAPGIDLTTLPASGVGASSATLNGSVVPGGTVSVYFEYGETTAYGLATPPQVRQGTSVQSFGAPLGGLKPATIYQFRAVATGPSGTVTGGNQAFTTSSEPPVVATGDPYAVAGSSATLVGAVDPKGLPTQVWFEYGLTSAYGRSTPPRSVTSAGGVLDVLAPSEGFIAGATYHYRIVASNAAGTSTGDDVTFVVVNGGGSGSPAPTAPPTATTGDILALQSTSVILLGNANPNGGTTLARFEYGPTAALGFQSAVQGLGNGNAGVAVSIPLSGLLPGTTYHYRLVSSNSLGTTAGGIETFTTAAAPPLAVTGDVEVLGTTTVRVNGSAKAGGSPTTVFVDYGTDPSALDNSVATEPAAVSGPDATPVTGTLENLGQGLTFFYRVRAVSPLGVTTLGETRSFSMASLSGLIQEFPDAVDPDARRGTLNVVISPPVAASGWRFLGERTWRDPGVPATGLTAGDRVIEFRPVAGFVQPANEPVSILSDGNPVPDRVRSYTPDGGGATGSVVVTLRPEGITEDTRPFELLAFWAVFGEVDGSGEPVWRASGTTRSGLPPGNHLLLLKPVDGRTTPAPATVRIRAGETTATTITYFVAADETGAPPDRLAFATLSSDASLPHGFIGQLRGDAGSGTGFVVRPGVVATAAHVMFDDGTLSSATGMQWLHRLDPQAHDPLPVTPRGYYMLTGYAAQREIDNSPGVSTPDSQNLDAAAVYFSTDPGAGGFSGYLASDTIANEFLESSALKTLAGYPVEGIVEADINHPHATVPSNVAFSRAFGRTYTTSDIRASGGVSGGPLSVRHENGLYYPAAIYLGGTRQMVVRAIDSEVASLIGFAESSAGSASGETRGSLTSDESLNNGLNGIGSLEVRIEPAAAREAGAGWRIQAGAPWYDSGDSLAELSPNTYTIQFATVPGFFAPAPQAVEIQAGFLRRITFRYEEILLAPDITPPATLAAVRGAPFNQAFSASNSPDTWSLQGVLPGGLIFDTATGILSGTANEAGIFPLLLGASNNGGADSLPVTLAVLPALANQSFTSPVNAPLTYQTVSSESGAGVLYEADALPSGLVINGATGVISGTPAESGTFVSPLRVTRRGATATATLELNITGDAPVITSHSSLAVTVPYNGEAVLSVAASGSPAPAYQWYRGLPGDVSQPVTGAVSATFTSPPLTAGVSFWARASSISGSADSPAFQVNVLPSNNPKLTGLVPSAGSLSPAFNADLTSYTLGVPNEVTALTLTPFAWIPQSVIRINGGTVASGTTSALLPLAVGANPVEILVTAGDGVTTRVYQVSVIRGAVPEVVTLDASNVTDRAARLRGTATPNGTASVFFEFGPTSAYGYTTAKQEISGDSPLDVQASLSGLPRSSTYHFRIGLSTAAGTIYGENRTFETLASAPVVATGDATDVTATEVKLIGAVDTNGSSVSVYFEWGETAAYGFTTPSQVLPAGSAISDVQFTADGLVPGRTYHYRLVAVSAEGTVFGDDVVFVAGNADGGNGTPNSPPLANTVGSADVTAQSATLIGSANPNGGTTFVRFEYGPTTAYGSVSETRSLGNGQDLSTVVIPVSDLVPGTTYHFRTVASNSSGTDVGEDATFTTAFLPPLAITGGASPLGSSSARLSGSVRARGTAADVYFEYGTDGVTFPNRIRATPGTVTGDGESAVTVNLDGLEERVPVFYRLVAFRPSNPASGGVGETKVLEADALAGLIQTFTREVPQSSREAELLVNLLPAGTGAWRFIGETVWRPSGVAVGGLTNGDRFIEFLPVPGFIAPPMEQVGIVNGEAPVSIERVYFETPDPANAALTVNLTPDTIAQPGVPVSNRAQWRLSGETAWRDSGTTATALPPGSYIVEFKAVPGRNKPPGAAVNLTNGTTSVLNMAYPPASAPILSPPVVVPYPVTSTNQSFPYAYVGEFRTDAGSQSGFVVKPRVVATTASAIFNDTTLSLNTGMQWLLQRDAGTYEPTPQAPRGAYVFTGYSQQRALENTPGTLTTTSMNLNAAALYFFEDAGRGGFSGYLSSDLQENPYLRSSAQKTLVGYPVNGVADAAIGRMHATPPATSVFAWETGRTFSSGTIRGFGGMEGGPLCVRFQQGAYFPAGIYVGGASRGMVRAIDGDMIDMFNRAENSGNGGDNDTGGGITQSSFSSLGGTTFSAIKVTIQPAAARNAGAGWRLSPESSYRLSGSQRTGLNAGTYKLEMKPVSGFETPAVVNVNLTSGNLRDITFTYEEANAAPTIENVTGFAINEDSPGTLVNFTVFDANNAASALTITRSSSNTALIPNANITLGGSGTNRSAFIVPAANQSGTSVITLTVSDGSLTASDTFTVTVNPVNDPPTITGIPAQSIAAGSSTAALPFTIGDIETPAASLLLSAESSDPTLVASSGIVFSGSGTSRGVTVTPVAGRSGAATITVRVSDGTATAETGFVLTVTGAGNPSIDDWRFANFGTTENTGDAADSADPDGDGRSNREEYAAGTDPKSAADAFGVASSSFSGGSFTTVVPGKAGRRYRLERGASLTGPWSPVANQGPLAADGEITLTDPAAPPTRAFYRVGVEAP